MTPRKPVRSYHHGDLKTVLKKAALELVREKGPRGFSLNEASRRAGVTVAAPYRHFDDKEALLAEIICDGNAILEEETRRAANGARTITQKMLEAGVAYLRFAAEHADYFSVMFHSGIDKSKYPSVQLSATRAFNVILGLAQQKEATEKLARERAVSAWALVHGLATLRSEGALSETADQEADLQHLKPILRRFLDQPYQ
jgi:AcrR family transcriptional regulator